MLTNEQKKKFYKIIISGLAWWIVLVSIVYFFVGNFKSAYPIGIIVIIAILRFIVPEYIKTLHKNRTEK